MNERTYLRHRRRRLDRVSVRLDRSAGARCVGFFVLAVDLRRGVYLISQGVCDGAKLKHFETGEGRGKKEIRTRSFFEMGMIAGWVAVLVGRDCIEMQGTLGFE